MKDLDALKQELARLASLAELAAEDLEGDDHV